MRQGGRGGKRERERESERGERERRKTEKDEEFKWPHGQVKRTVDHIILSDEV
jgi:hypothetical protein